MKHNDGTELDGSVDDSIEFTATLLNLPNICYYSRALFWTPKRLIFNSRTVLETSENKFRLNLIFGHQWRPLNIGVPDSQKPELSISCHRVGHCSGRASGEGCLHSVFVMLPFVQVSQTQQNPDILSSFCLGGVSQNRFLSDPGPYRTSVCMNTTK